MNGMERVARRCGNVVCWVVLCAAACNQTAQVTPARHVVSVAGVMAAYVPERKAVTIGWLPTHDAGAHGYEVARIGPLDLGTPVSNISGGALPLARVTETVYNDITIQPRHVYGYAVAISYADGNTGPQSSVTWVTVGRDPAAVPDDDPAFTQLCPPGAVTADAIVDRIRFAPAGTTRAGPPDAASPTLRIEGFLSKPADVEVWWKKMAVDGASENFGSSKKLSFTPKCNTETTEALTEFVTLAGPGAEPIADNVYALAGQLKFAGQTQRLYFPLDATTPEHIRMSDIAPPPGVVLKAGFHQFKGQVRYVVRSSQTVGLQLTVWLTATLTGGTTLVLDAQQFPVNSTGASETFGRDVFVPPDTSFVQLIARIGRGTDASVYIDDQVSYAVVP